MVTNVSRVSRFKTLFTLVCVFLPTTNCVNVVADYILQSGPLGHCDETISSEDSVFLRSHVGAGFYGGLTSYSANQDCQITFSAGTGKKVLIQFPFFDLQPPVGQSCFDRVYISELDPDQEVTTVPETTAAVTEVTTASQSTTADGSNVTDSNITMTTDNLTSVSTENPSTVSSENPSTVSTDQPTVSTEAPTSPGYIEPSGVNATFFNTSEVCNTTENNETMCWNVTESYVVFIADVTGAPNVTLNGSDPPTTVVCETRAPYVSTSSRVHVRFVSDSTNQKKGFSLLLTSFHQGSCSDSEFQCDTDRCVSATLKCDGASHCVDGADESKELAGCSLADEILGTVSGLGQYAVLAIAVITSGIVLTVFIGIMLWKFMKKDTACQCRCKTSSEDEEAVSPLPSATRVIVRDVTPNTEAVTTRHTKAVTIASASNTKSPKSTVDEHAGTKRTGIIKVEPVTSADVEW